MIDLRKLLRYMVDHEASDLFLSTGAPPSFKVHGEVVKLNEPNLEPGETATLAENIMDHDQRESFKLTPEMNLALFENNIGRFRVNIFRQRSQTSLVFRHIKTDIPTPESLELPPILNKLIMQKRGLLLMVGATGSGKSTTLASLVGYRNRHSAGHIVTIEDPIEFVHTHQKSIVNQREVGIDTNTYEDALKNTLRQAPDVILIGEIRARETMEHAIAFAETGHLCISTLHANNANQALDRIINFFPDERQKQLLTDLSFNLAGVISQRLIPSVDGKRTLAMEILLGTPLVRDLIYRGNIISIKEAMLKSENIGMQTFDSSLFKLYSEGKISMEEALYNADSPNNLRLRITLADEGVERTMDKLEASESQDQDQEQKQEQEQEQKSDTNTTPDRKPKRKHKKTNRLSLKLEKTNTEMEVELTKPKFGPRKNPNTQEHTSDTHTQTGNSS